MYNFPKQPRKEVFDRIDITDFVRRFLLELAEREGRPIRMNNEIDIMRVKALINDPRFTTFKSAMRLDADCPYWNEQEIAIVPSNLGPEKGCLFYFVCNGCGRRTKYLFFYDMLQSPICRQCCRLPYKQASYKERKRRQQEKVRSDGYGHSVMPDTNSTQEGADERI